MRDVLRGFNVPPIVVAVVRGAIEAGVLAALALVGANVEPLVDALPDSWQSIAAGFGVTEAVMISAGYMTIRTLEGVADQKIDPSQNRDADVRAKLDDSAGESGAVNWVTIAILALVALTFLIVAGFITVDP